jgi:hypothetical protein
VARDGLGRLDAPGLVVLGEQRADAAVRVAAGCAGERVVDDLLEQAVAEGELALLEALARDDAGLLEDDEAALDAGAEELLEEAAAEGRPDHGRDLERGLGGARQPVDAGGDDAARALGHLARAEVAEAGGQLLDEERVAAGTALDQRDVGVGRVGAEAGADERE